MNYRELVEVEVKGTVGFVEAENKKSFMTGVSVAISKMEDKYTKELENLRNQLKNANNNAEVYRTDLTTLSNIVTKYSNDD